MLDRRFPQNPAAFKSEAVSRLAKRLLVGSPLRSARPQPTSRSNLRFGRVAVEALFLTKRRSLKVFLRQRQPGPLFVPEYAGNPEASLGRHNLEGVDASRKWLALLLRT